MLALHVRLGVVFRSVRRELGITQEEVARRAGRPRADYSRFERGVHSPRLDHIELYAGILGLPVSDAVRLAERLPCELGAREEHPGDAG